MNITLGIEEGVRALIGGVTNSGGSLGVFQYVIIFLAILGAIGIISSLFTHFTQSITLVFNLFVVIPLIILVALLNKKQRQQRKEDLRILLKQAKEKNIKIKKWVWILFWGKMSIGLLVWLGAIVWLVVRIANGMSGAFT